MTNIAKGVEKYCRVIEITLFSSWQLPLTARIDCPGKNVRPATESEQLRIENNGHNEENWDFEDLSVVGSGTKGFDNPLRGWKLSDLNLYRF